MKNKKKEQEIGKEATLIVTPMEEFPSFFVPAHTKEKEITLKFNFSDYIFREDEIRGTLKSIKHILSGQIGIIKMAQKEGKTFDTATEMENILQIVQSEFERLFKGLPFSVPANHAKTRPEPGSAPFCHHKRECDDGNGCDGCQEFTLWADGYKE